MTNVFSFIKKQYKTLAEEVNGEAEYRGLSQPHKRYLLPIENQHYAYQHLAVF